jgi:hypothetical protein
MREKGKSFCKTERLNGLLSVVLPVQEAFAQQDAKRAKNDVSLAHPSYTPRFVPIGGHGTPSGI